MLTDVCEIEDIILHHFSISVFPLHWQTISICILNNLLLLKPSYNFTVMMQAEQQDAVTMEDTSLTCSEYFIHRYKVLGNWEAGY